MYKIQFSDKVSNIVRAARFDSMVRNFFEMFLRARRALEFSHSQDPRRTDAAAKSRTATSPHLSVANALCCHGVRGACAAGSEAADRRALGHGRFGLASLDFCFCAATA